MSEDARNSKFEAIAARLPAKRMGQAEDVANAIA
jgi:hypothetical protein